jgi:hypothetical protein
MEDTRSSVSRRAKILVLIAFVVYGGANLGSIVLNASFLPRPEVDAALNTCAGWLIPLSIYALALPWFIQNNKLINLRKPSARRRFPRDPEARVLLFAYPLFMGPSLYGVLLYHLGLSGLAAGTLAVVSLLTGIAWGIYNMRAS